MNIRVVAWKQDRYKPSEPDTKIINNEFIEAEILSVMLQCEIWNIEGVEYTIVEKSFDVVSKAVYLFVEERRQ